MQTILIINSKGGSGKTTLATTIASYFASRHKKTAIMDYDPQGSSLHWLKLRSTDANTIHAADAATQKGNLMRSLQMYVPENTEKLIIDAPAGVDGVLLQEMVKKAGFIVIPVLSTFTLSPISSRICCLKAASANRKRMLLWSPTGYVKPCRYINLWNVFYRY